jgi:hypothetical protein
MQKTDGKATMLGKEKREAKKKKKRKEKTGENALGFPQHERVRENLDECEKQNACRNGRIYRMHVLFARSTWLYRSARERESEHMEKKKTYTSSKATMVASLLRHHQF